MHEYKQLIENLAVNKEPMLYTNSGRDKAEIVFSAIFKYSKEEIYMCSGDMKGGISERSAYLKALDDFLSRGGKLKLMIEDYGFNYNQALYKMLAKYKFFNKDQVQVRRYLGMAFANDETNDPVHFCTGDDYIYRVEHDTINFKATGSFYNPKIVKQLKLIYNIAFNNAHEINLSSTEFA